MNQTEEYKYLLADYWSSCKLLFIKDPRKIRADMIYGQAVGEDARTPEELAADWNLPVEAVREAIHYGSHNLDLIRAERERENARWAEFEKKYPPLMPPDHPSHP